MAITGTIKPLKDKNGNYIFPETSSEAVYSSDGKTIEQKISIIENDASRLTTDKTITGAINELFINVSNGKQLLASAITDKGIPTLATDSFETIAKNISMIYTIVPIYKFIESQNRIEVNNTISAIVKNLSIKSIKPYGELSGDSYIVPLSINNGTDFSKFNIKIPFKLQGTKNKQNELVQNQDTDSFRFIKRVDSNVLDSNKWAANSKNMPTARNALGTHVYNNKIYCISGVSGSGNVSNVEIYDIESDTWASGANIPTARNSFVSHVYNGKIYCIGGSTSSSVSSIVEIYDIELNKWLNGSSIPTPINAATSQLYNGKIYCIGGMDNSSYTNKVQIYDISTDTWTTGSSMPTSRYHLTAQLYNGKIYCIGGSNLSGVKDEVEVYDISANSWSKITTMPNAKFALTSQIIDNYIYCLGGTKGDNSSYNSVNKYDVVNNTWTDDIGMITARYGLSSIIYNNTIYTIGGRNSSTRLNNIEYLLQKGDTIIEELLSEEVIELPEKYIINSYDNKTIIFCDNDNDCKISVEIKCII